MPRANLDNLRKRLLRSGVAPRYIERAISELQDHFEDIENETTARGCSRDAVVAQAAERMGAMDAIANQYSNKPELKRWIYRHPRIALVAMPVAYVLLSPAILVNTGAKYTPLIGRWCTSLLLGALATATMLLLMQLSIALT